MRYVMSIILSVSLVYVFCIAVVFMMYMMENL